MSRNFGNAIAFSVNLTLLTIFLFYPPGVMRDLMLIINSCGAVLGAMNLLNW